MSEVKVKSDSGAATNIILIALCWMQIGLLGCNGVSKVSKTGPNSGAITMNLPTSVSRDTSFGANRERSAAFDARMREVFSRVKAAKDDLRVGRFASAESKCRSVLADEPWILEMHLRLAQACAGQGKKEQAAAALHLYLLPNPSAGSATNTPGPDADLLRVAEQVNDLQLLNAVYEKIIANFYRPGHYSRMPCFLDEPIPLKAKALACIGLTYVNALDGNLAPGVAHLQRAVQIVPNNPLLHFELAEVAMRAEQFELAMSEYVRSVETWPDTSAYPDEMQSLMSQHRRWYYPYKEWLRRQSGH